eukprot:9540523-Lingulodinium_polyedra.AAC.1
MTRQAASSTACCSARDLPSNRPAGLNRGSSTLSAPCGVRLLRRALGSGTVKGSGPLACEPRADDDDAAAAEAATGGVPVPS